MSLGDFKLDDQKKTRLRSVITFLRPLLLVSIGIHALIMLVPTPDKVEVVEKEPELPKPIQVSELPELAIPGNQSVATPALVPPSGSKALSANSPSAPTVQPSQSSVSILRPSPEIERSQLPLQPQLPDNSTALPKNGTRPANPGISGSPSPSQQPESTSEPRPASQNPTPSRNISKDQTSATPTEMTSRLSSILQIDDSTAIPSKQIRKPLIFGFPSKDICLEGNPAKLASAAVIVLEDENGTTSVIDGNILDNTDYKLVGKWLDKTIFPSDQVDPNETQTVEIPPTPDFNPIQWISDNIDGPLFKPGEIQKAFTINIEVQMAESACTK